MAAQLPHGSVCNLTAQRCSEVKADTRGSPPHHPAEHLWVLSHLTPCAEVGDGSVTGSMGGHRGGERLQASLFTIPYLPLMGLTKLLPLPG